ncbi:MAG: DUF2784 domain-containing protein [Burkholderiales bacterium]|nr:DUF2784 domain-containing protein [Burkholderiales bacterium]
MHTLLANIILILHFAFVMFIVGGFALIWIGAALGWRWVRNLWFRVAHLVAIVFVAGEALAGVWCPLTVWEDMLRGGERGEMSFIARWVHRILFYSLPDWVFTFTYLVFALVVAATWWLVRPGKYK